MNLDMFRTAATPRPWDVEPGEPQEILVHKSHYREDGGLWIARTQNAENARLIVLAVNSYEAREARIAELVVALTDATKLINDNADELVGFDHPDNINRVVDQAQAALAAAKKVQP